MNRKNRYHSSDNFQLDSEMPSSLTAFLKNSPSFEEVKAQPRVLPNPPMASEVEEFRMHYQVIERVLNDQNTNLKKQAEYLSTEMRKSLRREKILREELDAAESQCSKIQQRLTQSRQEGQQMQDFVQSKIILMLSALKMNQLHDLQQEIARIVQELCEYFNVNVDIKVPVKIERYTFSPPPSPLLHRKQELVNSKIEELNAKFESLMFQYKSTSRVQIRKQCIDIAKQIKQLKSQKDKSDSGKMEKTVQNLSRIHSQDQFSKASIHSHDQFFKASRNPSPEEQRNDYLANTEERGFKRQPQVRIPSRKTTAHASDRPSSFPYPLLHS